MATKSEAQKAMAVLMTVYPRMEDKTPAAIKQFVEYASQSLMSYPQAILAEMVHPRTGITTQCKHFPSIAEMREFCDPRMKKAWENKERDARDMNRSVIEGPKEGQLSPEKLAERERVKAGFKKLLAELGSIPDPFQPRKQVLTREEEKARAEAWLEAERVKAEPLPKMSPDLRKVMGVANV